MELRKEKIRKSMEVWEAEYGKYVQRRRNWESKWGVDEEEIGKVNWGVYEEEMGKVTGELMKKKLGK
jgi:hypothetical protein